MEIDFGDGRVAKCVPILEQPYENCTISAGIAEGIEPDTVYLRFEREEPTTIFMRPDEMLAVLWACSGTLWSVELAGQIEERLRNTRRRAVRFPTEGK